MANILSGVQSLRNKISPGSVNPAETKLRKDFVKIAKQLQSTQKILAGNQDEIDKLIDSGDEKAKLLKNELLKSDSKTLSIINKINEGRTINSKEGQALVKKLQGITTAVEDMQINLEVPIKDLVDTTQDLLNNSEIDRDDKREMIQQLTSVASTADLSDEQLKILKEIKDLNSDDLNFTKEQNAQLNSLFNDLSDNTTDIKIKSSLQELNKNMDAATLTNGNLTDFLEQQDADGRSFKDLLEGGLDGDLGGGLMDTLFGALGLGSFTDIAGIGKGLFKGGKGVGKGIGSLVGKAGGLLGFGGGAAIAKGGGRGVSKIAAKASTKGGIKVAGNAVAKGGGKLLKGAGRILGKAALPLAAILAVVDFMDGVERAGELAGKEAKDLTSSDKLSAGIAGIVEGLTFGLVSAEDTFKTIDGVVKKITSFGDSLGLNFTGIQDTFAGIFSEKGIIGKLKSLGKFLLEISPVGLIAKVIGKLTGGFDGLFGEKGLFSKMSMFFKKVMDFDFTSIIPEPIKSFLGLDKDTKGTADVSKKATSFSPIGSLLDSGKSVLGNIFGGKGQASNEEIISGVTPLGSAKGSTPPAEIDNRAFVKMTKDNAEKKNMERAQAAKSNEKVVVVQAPAQSSGKVVSRVKSVDNFGLNMINAGKTD